MCALPLIDLPADPLESGRIHGRAARPAIGDNVETYLSRFALGGVDRAAALAEAGRWAKRIRGFNEAYAEEMRGIAEGAEVPLEAVALLNVRYELSYSLFAREAASGRQGSGADRCTSFAALPEVTGDGGTVMAQNWDWMAGLLGRLVVLRRKGGACQGGVRPGFVCVSQAGIAGGMMGLNEAGLGLCVNGLISDHDGRHATEKPFHVRVREILEQPNLNRALKVVLETDRVCSANFLLGHADGEAIDVEAAPDRAGTLSPEDGFVVHANHFEAIPGITSLVERTSPSTLYRGPRLARRLRRANRPLDHAAIRALLGDHAGHPWSICRHPDPAEPEARRTMTVASVILDLDRRVLYASDGPPCEHPYEAFPLDA
jgi:isopenicillin-N N-acyltransferase-like protein